jgi:hypothetical protein
LVILPILVLWFRIVHQNDEILALIPNEVRVIIATDSDKARPHTSAAGPYELFAHSNP